MKLWDLYKGRDYKIEPTLNRIREAVNYVGEPHRSYPSILIGGTNGKGSSCAFLERILREHGFKTGWFVSPHLVYENERWRVKGTPMEDSTLEGYVSELKGVFERFNLTYFEAATLIALLYFKDSEVDVAVLEVGMGGRWDATKVSEPILAGITNVERDHTKWLGRNIEEIARDKLHLYMEGKPFVIGSSRYPLYPVAVEMGIRNMVVAGQDYLYRGELKAGLSFLSWYEFNGFELKDAELGLLGKWQIDNASFALTLGSLFTELEEEVTKKALKLTRWEGRMEVIRYKPLLILDGSHNPYAVNKVVKEVKRLFPSIKFLFTGLFEKDWALSMEVIRRYADSIYLVQVSHYRGEPVSNLYKKAVELEFKEIVVLSSPSEVLKIEEDLCALGSLYLIGEIKEAFANAVI
ncbi:dihydrofolate synthase/folylpolyglutamate synthase [Hydrogenivirga caldilitoris]|uniref:tetrahydrofolate synthase n=1 Tax=Hydrogenivirga caldilitoris TaxID=246264 RepID=A0A497XU90_9AQUI|nr:folylpolyglutamate synthase/dihydrofolate synthase family protein [Hydrogenivirga caldilitoris]RLJ71589.1 dihydrofolate synthase/folylpolyglutamate synthase [Hydrogenivirga caldilitoris]